MTGIACKHMTEKMGLKTPFQDPYYWNYYSNAEIIPDSFKIFSKTKTYWANPIYYITDNAKLF